jgi:hypothetical protein
VQGPLPFNDAGNPVMAQVAFLTAMVSPKIAAAAAQRALEVTVLMLDISSVCTHRQWVITQHRGAAHSILAVSKLQRLSCVVLCQRPLVQDRLIFGIR